VNVPELVHEGHWVVEPSGCIRIMDESGIQLKNHFDAAAISEIS